MFKGSYHPNSFLSERRNVRPGLVARTKIVLTLEKGVHNTRALVQETKLSYSSVRHHLHLLENERVVFRKEKPYSWELTGSGQQRLAKSQKP
jgi:predicted transcriptional regulator